MNKKAISTESLFVMILFMMFTISMVSMIISGKTSYGKILDEKEQTEKMRISTSYLRMKLKQNNQVNAVQITHDTNSDMDLLEIYHDGEESEYKTIIYYYDGKICEAYLAEADSFTPELGEPVVDVDAETIRFVLVPKGVEILYTFAEEEVKQFVAMQLEGMK
ncbi:DUF4860 domain-containing protein [Clostridiales bacterium COT073_COT-073]|nr:DUF4860 domain-containing protein [Clostridiales bacterium COT073_COT-073]